MFESEANRKKEPSNQLPAETLSQFTELTGKLTSRTLLSWGEHCTECAFPQCYVTCDLYSPRQDGKCRRFVDGMVRIAHPDSINGYLLKIRFKRWGQLWAVGNCHLFSLSRARFIESCDLFFGNLLQRLPLPNTLRSKLTGKYYGLKKKWADYLIRTRKPASHFVLEVFNPMTEPIELSVIFRPTDLEKAKMPFQTLITVLPGFQRFRIPTEEISRLISLSEKFSVYIVPNQITDGTTLYFGLIDFVREKIPTLSTNSASANPCKCLVWDLDNTLWEGILVEDGAENLHLKPGIVEIIKQLDNRGILHSIASKNNAEDVLRVLKRWNLDEYFLYPQISWQPKSQSVQQIAKSLNIGLDSIILIDDSKFERAEVIDACPGVRAIPETAYLSLVDRPEFQAPNTEESRGRRRMYQVQAIREVTQGTFKNDYSAFLKHCDIKLHLFPLSAQNIIRVHELTQRTNQMNFSGNRYQLSQLEEMLQQPHIHTYVMECADRFGNYGTIGFCVVDSRRPIMTDLMFSCRVQAKRVEHAFLSYILSKYLSTEISDFFVSYRQTKKNLPSGKVFEDFGFKKLEEKEGVSLLSFSKEQKIPDDKLITIVSSVRAAA